MPSEPKKIDTLPLTLFLGGTRSGKSSLAEEYAIWCLEQVSCTKPELLYIATASAYDSSMQNRIERHQKRRPAHWHTAEIERKLAKNIEILLHDAKEKPKVILIDCVTLWISNILFTLGDDVKVENFENTCAQEIQELIMLMKKHNNVQWIMVSGETGLGGIGATRLERFFQDGLGLANQLLAEVSRQSFLCIAGRAMPLVIERPWL